MKVQKYGRFQFSRSIVGCGFAFMVLCSSAVQADTDCSARESTRDDPNWSCLQASNWSGGCVPSSSFESWKCLELDADAELCDDGGSFNMSVYLTQDDVSLDCNGQLIDHHYQDGDPKYPGIRTPYTYSVSNISIEGCAIQNTGRYGVDLKRFFRGSQLSGAMAGQSNISVHDVSVHNVGQWGIYVGQNSRGISISNTIIDDAYGGVYLEAGSVGTRITDAMIVNSFNREGIAIDSSANNVIERSFFSGNEDGINIYKNCGETGGQICPITRALGADDNLIRGNTFDDDGVNVAWRQFDVYGIGFCENIDVLGYWRDHAANNVFDGNQFDSADLVVEDGPVVVHNNRFAYGSMLEVGTSVPWLWPGNGVHVHAVVASNTFGNAADIDIEGSVTIAAFNNDNFAGACEPYNSCDFGPTTMLGRTVHSAGIWAVLL